MVINRIKSIYFLIFFSFGVFFPYISIYLKEIGLNEQEIGAILSIGPVVTIFMQPIWGMISDKIQKTSWIIVICIFLTGLIGFIYNYTSSFALIILIAIFFSIFQSGIIPLVDGITIEHTKKFNLNYGTYRLWGAIGYSIAVYITGILTDSLGIFLIFYLLLTACTVSSFISFKVPSKEKHEKSLFLNKDIQSLLSNPKVLKLLFAYFLIFGPIYANDVYFGLFVKELGGSNNNIGLAFFIGVISEVPFMWIASYFINKLGYNKTILLSSILTSFRWVLYYLEPNLYIVYLSTVLQGVSLGLLLPATIELISNITKREIRHTVIAIYTAVSYGLGSWFGTFIGGIITNSFSMNAMYLFYSITTFAGVLIFIFSMKKDKMNHLEIQK